MRPVTWVRALVPLLAIILVAVACGTSGAANAGSVKVVAVWSGQEQASFMAVLKPFEDSTGIKVQYESTRDEDAILRTRVAAGNAPDLAAAPSPQLLTQFAKDGKVKSLNDAVDMNALAASTSQGWIKLGEPLSDGKLYQIFSWAAVKGLVWYDPKNFSSKSYSVPKTWQDLLTLQDTIKSGGTPPWCIAVASGGAADGWPASDWLKEIVLSQAGPSVYDKWVAGTQTWTSPEIKSAFQTFGTILGPNDSNVYGGKNTILATQFGDVGTPMFASPPKCYMLNQASFITTFFTSAVPSLQAGTDFTFFPLPDINTSFAGAHVVAGDSWSMFNDTLSAQILVNTQIAKYDATDNMPTDMRNAAWKGLLKFISNQGNLDSILADLDKTQKTAYTAA
jgi:alpha-glucoside transport system substrate-binding protein